MPEVQVSIEGLDGLLSKLDTLAKNTKELHPAVPQEFVRWSNEDLRRKYANVVVTGIGNETTSFTRLPLYHRESSRGRKRRRRKGPKVYGALTRKGGKRPVLRPELLQKLYERIERLAKEMYQWP